MNRLYAALAFILSLAAVQPALAEAPIGQMIDDTGLVISSYADGTISEEKLKTSGQIALKLAHKNTSHAGTILKDSDLALLTHK